MSKTKNKKYNKKKSYKKRGGNIKQLAKETAVLLAKSVARLSLQSIKSGTKMSTSLVKVLYQNVIESLPQPVVIQSTNSRSRNIPLIPTNLLAQRLSFVGKKS